MKIWGSEWINDLPYIWKNSDVYPEEKYIFLLKIMEKFQLCFEVKKGEYLVAELLENAEKNDTISASKIEKMRQTFDLPKKQIEYALFEETVDVSSGEE